MTGQPLYLLAEVNILLLWYDSLSGLDYGFYDLQVYSLSASANIHPSTIPCLFYLEVLGMQYGKSGRGSLLALMHVFMQQRAGMEWLWSQRSSKPNLWMCLDCGGQK